MGLFPLHQLLKRLLDEAPSRTRTGTIVYSLLLSLVVFASRILLHCHDLLKNLLS